MCSEILLITRAFLIRKTEPKQADVRLRLAQQDMQNIQDGKTVESHISPSAMISMGLELEESKYVFIFSVRFTLSPIPVRQRRKMQSEISSLGTHATSLQKAQLHEKLNSLYRKLLNWFEIQLVYIPSVATLRSLPPSQSESFDLPDIPIVNTDLWLPSSIRNKVHWNRSLGEHEWSLRMAQANDSLEDLRQNLYLRDFLLKRKKDWSRGVRENTRSQTVIDRANAKVIASAAKYRIARIALSQLAPILDEDTSWASELRELSESDIEGLPAEGWGEGRRRLSWIWVVAGVGAGDGPHSQPLTDGT